MSDETMLAAAPTASAQRQPLTDEQIASVCLSMRHDFGLLDEGTQANLLFMAREWERAFAKEAAHGTHRKKRSET